MLVRDDEAAPRGLRVELTGPQRGRRENSEEGESEPPNRCACDTEWCMHGRAFYSKSSAAARTSIKCTVLIGSTLPPVRGSNQATPARRDVGGGQGGQHLRDGSAAEEAGRHGVGVRRTGRRPHSPGLAEPRPAAPDILGARATLAGQLGQSGQVLSPSSFAAAVRSSSKHATGRSRRGPRASPRGGPGLRFMAGMRQSEVSALRWTDGAAATADGDGVLVTVRPDKGEDETKETCRS